MNKAIENVKCPSLTVVVVAFNGAACLEKCLTSLETQTLTGPMVEVLVVGNFPAASDAEAQLFGVLHERFPFARWLSSPQETNVPGLRGIGMAQAKAPIVVLLEDDCIAANPNWCTSILDAHNRRWPEAVVVGGAVEPGSYRRAWDWAIFFAEYGGRFLLPVSGGDGVPAEVLPGTNISYKVKGLEALATGDDSYRGNLTKNGFYEAFAHQALREKGLGLQADNNLVVHNINSWSVAASLRSRFHHGRGYAGMRFAGRPRQQQFPYMAGTLLLPLIQAARILSEVRRRKRFVGKFAYALPSLLLCAASWSAGEFVGYGWGAGNSLKQWR